MENQNTEPNKNEPGENSKPAETACACCKGGWKWLIILGIALLAILWLSGSSEQKDTNATDWGQDYNAALEQAKKENKPLLIAFHAKGCMYCTKMKKVTYPDAAVMSKLQQFIPVLIDTQKQNQLATQFNIGPVPAYRVVRPDGTVADSFVGFQPPENFTITLDKALKKVN